MNIVLTKRAQRNFYSIKDYIAWRWGEFVAAVFEEKVVSFLGLLKNFGEIGTIEEPNKQIRGFQLSSQTKILYRIKNERIIILAFFDVRQNPNKKLI